MRLSAIPFLIFALPLAEIAGFVFVGRSIGVLATLALVLASGIVGAIMLRIQGFGAIGRISREMQAGRDPSREVAHGAMIMLAGILLVIPGFVTDLLGILLFIPPVRDVAWRLLRGRITVRTAYAGRGGGFGRRGNTIDLDADEYSASRPPGPRRDEIGRE